MMSAVGLTVCIVFACIGIGFILILPGFGSMFGLLWTLLALIGTGLHAVNLFTERGVAHEVVEFDTSSHSAGDMSPEQRLRRLDELRTEGLLNELEYQEQRKRVLAEL